MAQGAWLLPVPELPMAMRLAPVDPVLGCEGLNPCAGHARQGSKVESGEGLTPGQLRLLEMALDAAGVPFGKLDLGEGCQQAQ